ncbi:MAG: hypothetical protein APF80_12365 [Alphaproteobacteria bacterium BRH_c36]|nr:MAG: hypothetical protein APF80_12365 [Alphaproteobacteria bacterium BRH_c36]
MVRAMKRTTTMTVLDNIKASVPIDIALAHYGITLKVSGNRLTGVCPIHHGSNKRAFVVSADRRAWYCFGDCRRGGSVLDLVMTLENCSLSEAGDRLADRYGVKP